MTEKSSRINNLIVSQKIKNVVKIQKVTNRRNSYLPPEIEKSPTFNKIYLLQTLLKEMTSIKQQFEDNKMKMIEKINSNCKTYYNNIIGMKKIFDYCCYNLKETFEYNLSKIDLILDLNPVNKSISDFILLIRNDNSLMLKIIENCEKNDFDNMSDFLINFCYEETINSSFIQEELMIILYLLIENLIHKKFPPELSKNDEIYSTYLKKTFLLYAFKYLTRKADIRNYLCSILSEIILFIERQRKLLSVETGRIAIVLNDKNEQNKQILTGGDCGRSSQTFSTYYEIPKNSNPIKRFSKCLMPYNTNNENNDNLRISFFGKTNSSNEINKMIQNNYETVNDYSSYCGKSTLSQTESGNLTINEFINNSCVIDIFFEETDVTLNYLKEKLKEYEKQNSDIYLAMSEHLKKLINEVNSEENIEKFSNMLIVKALQSIKSSKNEEYFTTIVDSIKNNHQIICEIIDNILSTLNENINSLPFLIKCISNSFEQLLTKKYGNKITLYQKYMIKANFLIGNIILPVLRRPDYNGIITTDVVSKVTYENLEIIVNIFKIMLSGKLFELLSKPCFTIFNQYIIETMPKIFEIVQKLEHNFKMPNILQSLIDTSEKIDSKERLINYDFFAQNRDEKFQCQSICFSFLNLNSLVKIINKIKDNLNFNGDDAKDKMEIINNFIKQQKFFAEKSADRRKIDYLFFTKLNYLKSFENKINSILKDNFVVLTPPNQKEFNSEEVIRYKKCLMEVLSYVNLLHKENFNPFIEAKQEKIIHDYDTIKELNNYQKNCDYYDIINDNTNKKIENNENINIIKGLEGDKDEDVDFKSVILPQILTNTKNEMSFNFDKPNVRRLLYCCSYLQLHIDFLPEDYTINNYSKLFIEIIKDTETSMQFLKNNILNQLHIKIKGGQKTNMILSSSYIQIKNMEKFKIIDNLYLNIVLPSKFNIEKNEEGIITKIEYVLEPEQPPSDDVSIKTVKPRPSFIGRINPFKKRESATVKKEIPIIQIKKENIYSLINIIPDFLTYENKVDDIVDLEEKCEMNEALNNYFKVLRSLVKKENIVKKYSKEEVDSICYELENYILYQLYDKLFPSKFTKEDTKFYNKCCRLDFVKPENLISDKNMVNEKLWQISMDYINEINDKFTPLEKIKSFAKAFNILQNSITFCSGKNELGVDDTIKPLIYVLLKAKPKNIFSNFNYSQLFLNPDLSKKQYGILLTQMNMIMNIIKEMKNTDLIGVSKEQFGTDE